MALPAALNVIPLHGRILKADATGTPATGTVSFRIEQTLRDTTDHVLLTPTTLTATLDTTGAFTISLPATDDPDVTPLGWTYVVTVVTNALNDTWRISVPVATVGTLEFADIAPAVTPSTLVTYVLASKVGLPLGVASLGADGLVPTSQLPAAAGGTGPAPASTVTDETTYGVAKAVGASAAYARGDHTHGSPATPTAASVGADASGAATTAVSGHNAATDPHADRAYTDTQVSAKPSLTSSAATASAVGDTAAVGVATLAARGDHKHAREAFGGVPPVDSGSGTAGVAATVSRSDHVHPMNVLAPSDHGLISWNFPPYAATGAALAPVSGTIYVVKILIPAATTITNLVFGFNVAGTLLTAGQNFAALYSSAKALLSASADQTTSWGTLTGPAVIALTTPQAVAAGYVYATFLSNFTPGTGTAPTLNRGIGNINNVGLTSATAAYATAGTAQTSMPGTITTTSYTAASIWAAVS